jgi:hypothetical protein
MGIKLGDLFVSLGVKADIPVLKEFNKSLKDITVGGAATIASVAGVSLEFKHLFDETMNAALGLQTFKAQTGLSSQELQVWQQVAERANVSAESVSGSIVSLQQNIANIRMGKGNVAPFQLLGLDIQKDPFALLGDIRARLQNVSRPVAANLIQQLGFSPDMIQLLTLTNKQLKDLGVNPDLILSEKNQKKYWRHGLKS